MNDSREKFEKVATKFGMVTRRDPSGNYLWADTEVSWLFWQGGERQALERAAQTLDNVGDTYQAGLIRSLLTPPDGEKG